MDPSSIRGELLIRGPKYSSDVVPTSYCARYARMAAQDLFGIKYPVADAWKMRSQPGVGAIQISSTEELDSLVRDGRVKPGMLFGFNFPWTLHAGDAQKAGADYTHLALLIDIDRTGELYFADKFRATTRPRVSLSKMGRFPNFLKPREALYLQDS